MRVLIADDHALFRQSLKTLLESRGIEVVGQAGSGREAVTETRRLRPDLVLMDLKMPDGDGLAATRTLAAEVPETSVVVLTATDDDEALFEAIKAGAQGYLLKDVEADRFLALLESAARGEPALTPSLANKVLREFAKPRRRQQPDALTDREEDVLRAMVSGVTTNRQLASHLGISDNTVKFHVRNILDKLHLHNRAEVISYALRSGLVEPEEPDSA